MKRKGIYRPTIEDAIEISGIETLHPGGFALTKRTARLGGLRKGIKVLDVSSGRGTQSIFYAREFGADVTGVDIDDGMVGTASQAAKSEGLDKHVRFRKGDSQSLPFPDGSFDVVINECAVGIPDDSQKVLDEMVRVARKGGTVLMHESIWLAPLSKREKEEFSERYGTTPFELDEWVSMLQKAGAKNVIFETDPWSRPEMFWKIRKDRDVKHWLFTMSVRETLVTAARIFKQYGIRGVFRVFQNELIFYRWVLAGRLGYALFKGEK
jgi:SAM-dependent methyltransferase